jgi:hypothetical protein
VEALLAKHRLRVAEEKHLGNGLQLRTCEGPIINIFSTGTVQLQGRRPELAREFVDDLRAAIAEFRHRRWIARRGEDDAS